ncbi:MAG TPA: hypothetical protein VHX38_18920 [Pseudonocardiaceae bacterium]|jgi:hypothetical protein|nr:hypothetical protein [Pseudonocardiaceae bacterium]
MTTVQQGQSLTLTAQFFEYESGPAQDVTDLTITITAPDSTVDVATTSTGITHVTTGTYQYVWAVPADAVLGDHLVAWVANEASASELVTVTTNVPSGSTNEVWYCTREDVKAALDVPEVSWRDAQIDRAIEGASRSIEGDLGRYFYPQYAVETFDWPDHQYSAAWRLWLDQRELTSVTSVTTAGIDITSSVMLRPDDAPLRGFPYTKVEIDLSSSAAFSAGQTFQRSIAITGTFGFCAGETTGGTMVSAFSDTTGTTGTVSDASLIGVGNIIRVDAERMIVTGRGMASTSQTLLAPGLTALNSNNTVPVTTGAEFDTGEIILIDSEQMLITTVAGNNLTVNRAWNGSVLAAHTAGATIYAPRLLTVQRGVLGTTAATHSANAAVNVHLVPPLIRSLAVAETLNSLVQERRGYTTIVKRSSGTSSAPGDPLDVSTALDDLRKRAAARYKRLRTRTAARLV